MPNDLDDGAIDDLTKPDAPDAAVDDAGSNAERDSDPNGEGLSVADGSGADGEDAATDLIVDADLPDADLTPTVCPVDACPAAFPCVGTADDYFCRGQFAEFPLPSRRAGRSLAEQQYEVNASDGTVLDRVTGLMWPRVFVGLALPHAEASAYCATLSIGGYADFRLPSVHELITLFGAEVAPELDSTVFIGAGYAFSYWTTTPDTEQASPHYFSLFFMEYALIAHDAQELRGAQCVRTHTRMAPAGTPAARFTLEAAGQLVHDTHTTLVWERDLPLGNSSLTFAQAAAHCDRLTIDGHRFRLPSIAEALSILDYSKPTGMRSPPPFTGRNVAAWTRTEPPWNAERGSSDRWTVAAAGWLGPSSTRETDAFGVRCVALP